MHPEQAAFEKLIDENPLDSNKHMVYADWLDEHDQPDEAAFRRVLGTWLQSGDWGSLGEPSYKKHEWEPTSFHDADVKVTQSSVPREFDGLSPIEGLYPHSTDPTRPNSYRSSLRLIWPTWRDMETGLRQVFMNNLNRQRSEKLKRRVEAVRLYLRYKKG